MLTIGKELGSGHPNGVRASSQSPNAKLRLSLKERQPGVLDPRRVPQNRATRKMASVFLFPPQTNDTQITPFMRVDQYSWHPKHQWKISHLLSCEISSFLVAFPNGHSMLIGPFDQAPHLLQHFETMVVVETTMQLLVLQGKHIILLGF